MEKTTNKEKILYRKEYIARINKVIDYIERNIDTSLDLNKLAGVAYFSPFHFHRIFLAVKGETLNAFLRRKRLEKSASYLISSDETISDIAVKCGFNSNSTFARAFKEHFLMSATEFRNGGMDTYFERLGGECKKSLEYFKKVESVSEEIVKSKKPIYSKVEIREIDSFWVAYCRHTGDFDGIGQAFEKLFQWAGPRGLAGNPEGKVITLYHDDPNVTHIEKLQQSACLSIDPSVKVEGEIGKMLVNGGKFACGSFEISEFEFTEAWTSMCAVWLPDSGYELDDKLPFELYFNNHEEHPEKKFIVDICIPVRPFTHII